MTMPLNPPVPLSAATAQHYTWGSTCDGWHLLSDPNLSVIQEAMPPGSSEVRHLHLKAQQFFFVLSGELSIELEASSLTLPSEHGLHVPAGSAHRVANASDRPAIFLVISSPPSHGDRVLASPPSAS